MPRPLQPTASESQLSRCWPVAALPNRSSFLGLCISLIRFRSCLLASACCSLELCDFMLMRLSCPASFPLHVPLFPILHSSFSLHYNDATEIFDGICGYDVLVDYFGNTIRFTDFRDTGAQPN